MDFNKMSIREKFAQMILIGLDTYHLNDEIIKIIKNHKIGGIILYQKNYNSLKNMENFINKLKEINENNIPLFISIDQENGRVNRLPKEIKIIYSPLKQAKTKNMKLIDEVNNLTIGILKDVGVNMNFAPCLDICRDENNKAIGNRSYGMNYLDVCKYALPFMYSMKKSNIISVIKHFPGHGATKKDTHFIRATIKNVDLMEKEDIIPFEYAVKNGADAIMLSHLKIKGFGLKPTSTNKDIIDTYLIDRCKFNGLVITDDLRMTASKSITGLKSRIYNSIKAGNNIIMIKYKKGDYKFYDKLFKKIEKGKINKEIINNNAKKILEIKDKYKLTNKLTNSNLDTDMINEKIKKINDYILKNI